MTTPVDVAIVGAGPTGVVLASLLAKRGLTVHVSDSVAEVMSIPRALSLDHEVQRVFQQIGALDAVRPFIEPFTHSEFFGASGQLIRRMTMVAAPYPQGHVPSVVFSQPPVEHALRANLAALPGVHMALGLSMTGLTQNAEGVQLRYSDASRVQARYAVACDGGASSTRAALGIALEDLGFDEPWLVVDVLCNAQGLAKLPTTSVQYCEPARPCSLIIGTQNHRRWEISLLPCEDPQAVATPERTWALLARWLTPQDGQLWRQTSYRFHALVATQWRVGHVFLAGDAAHMQPPFLGQGMCQGVRDAANLAWKLAAVLQGHVKGAAAERLLDSYCLERGAHVRELTTRIKGVGAVICERDAAKAQKRDEHMLAACGGVVKDTPRQDILPPLSTGLQHEVSSSGRGALFPQPRLLAGPLMDDVCGHGWRLVHDGSLSDASLAPASGIEFSGLTQVNIQHASTAERDGVVAAWMQRHACLAALVRPDHYVYGTANNSPELQALLAGWQARMQGELAAKSSESAK